MFQMSLISITHRMVSSIRILQTKSASQNIRGSNALYRLFLAANISKRSKVFATRMKNNDNIGSPYLSPFLAGST